MALSPTMNVMLRAVEKAGKSLVRDFGEVEQLQVSVKGPGDFVSAADIRSEKILFEELSKARPDFGFLMEEKGKVEGKDNEYRWIIDPLDGTTNFLHGIPHWCISLALEHNNEIVAGVIYDPVKDELFRAEKGDGAFMRNKRLRASGRKDLHLCVIGCGLAKPNKAKLYARQLTAIQTSVAGHRNMGSAALDLAYVAAGRLDGFWYDDLAAWDAAAGSIIVREAGGYIGTVRGGSLNPVYDGDILASNANIGEPLRKLLQPLTKEAEAA